MESIKELYIERDEIFGNSSFANESDEKRNAAETLRTSAGLKKKEQTKENYNEQQQKNTSHCEPSNAYTNKQTGKKRPTYC